MDIQNMQLFTATPYENHGQDNVVVFGRTGICKSFTAPVDMEFVRLFQCVTCKNIEQCMRSREKEPPVEKLCPKYEEDKEMLEPS